jgi:hypothetical protein
MVLTLGAPFAADADRSHASLLFRLLNGQAPSLDPTLARRLRTAPPVPTWAIYSRSDGVVPWRHCRQEDDTSTVLSSCESDPAPADAGVRNVEVRSSHLSMPWNAQVLRVVREALRLPLVAQMPVASNPSASARCTH